jgi:hypothetical protein
MFYGRFWSNMCLAFCNTLWPRRGERDINKNAAKASFEGADGVVGSTTD